MNCPYCNFELIFCDKTVSGKQVAVCRNPKCKYAGWHLPVEIFDKLNDGKCAAHNLSVVREQFDRGYDTWVRSDKDLRQKLNQAQDALKIVEDKLQQIHLGAETSIDPRSHEITLVVIQSIASDALKIIAPITKQDTKEQKAAQIKIQDLFPLFKKPGWVAMDSNKRWYWYAYEPTINRRQETFTGLSPKDLSCMFNIAPFEGDWKDSLMECGNTHEQVETK